MDQATREILITRLEQLPPVLLEPLRDGSVRNFVQAAGAIYELTTQQQTLLENEIALTFLGYELISTLEDRMQENVVMSLDTADSILYDMTIALTSDLAISQLVGIEQHYTGDTSPVAIEETDTASDERLPEEIVTNEQPEVATVEQVEATTQQPPAPAPQPAAEEVPQAPVTEEPSVPQQHTSPAPEGVTPVHTMEHDIDRIHGYGAYRKMYPETNAAENEQTPLQENADLSAAVEEHIVSATPQDEVLKRPPLADTPTYTDAKKEGGR